jgi:hypothetical protein
MVNIKKSRKDKQDISRKDKEKAEETRAFSCLEIET